MLRSKSFYLWAIVVVTAILVLINIKNGHDWGGDFALYIEQAEAVGNNLMNELYEINHFTIENSQKPPGPYLYPNGYPVLLAPVYALFGLNFIALKIFTSLFFIFSLFLLYKIFEQFFDNICYVYLTVIFIAFNFYYIIRCDALGPDIPYYFLSLATIYLMQRSKNYFTQVCLGMLICYSYFTRDIGIVLLPTLFVYQVFNSKTGTRKLLYNIVPYISFALLYLLLKIIFPQKGGENHFALLLSHLSVELIVSNILYYCKLIASALTINHISIVVSFAIMSLVMIGLFLNLNKLLYIVVYVVGTVSVFIIWPSQQGMRFLFPVIPFSFFFFVEGYIYIAKKFKQEKNGKRLLIVYAALFALINFGIFVYRPFVAKSNECYTDEMKGIYSYISNNVPYNKIIAFKKPRVLRLFTGRQSICVDWEHFDDYCAEYMLIENSKITTPLSEKYILVRSFENYSLIVKNER